MKFFKLTFAGLLKISLCACSCALLFANTPSSQDQLEEFYGDFLCEEKEVLSAVGLSSPCTCAGCGTIPYPTDYKTPDPIINSPQVWSFVSEPDLHPMKITVNTFQPGTSSGFVFLAPYGFSSDATYGQSGSLMVDSTGNPIWFRPLPSPNLMNTDFRVQTFHGKPVLTFWQGTLATPPAYTNAPGGSSEPGSCYYILDNTYAIIKTISAQKGFISDIHEFLLTPRNTALFLSTKTVPMDLTPYGGPKHGFIQDFAIQEIDLHTNELLFFWDALEHIPLTDSYQSASSATSSDNIWDVYHLNSIGLTDDVDDIIVSSRSTWTIYRINKPTGDIVWRLGGKQSSFTIASDGEFSWQHDARFLPNNRVSLFDDNSDGSSDPEPPSHGLILQLDLNNMIASVYRTYYHDPNISAASQGNLQSLSNGNKFIGWGQSPYYSEYNEAGNTEGNPALNLLYAAQIPSTNYSYRAYRHDWIGKPFYPPSIGIVSSSGLITVYASWNGSTKTTQWQVFSGSKPKKLSLVGSAERSGFETAIPVNKKGPYFQVKALNSSGKVIGESKIVKLGSSKK